MLVLVNKQLAVLLGALAAHRVGVGARPGGNVRVDGPAIGVFVGDDFLVGGLGGAARLQVAAIIFAGGTTVLQLIQGPEALFHSRPDGIQVFGRNHHRTRSEADNHEKETNKE